MKPDIPVCQVGLSWQSLNGLIYSETKFQACEWRTSSTCSSDQTLMSIDQHIPSWQRPDEGEGCSGSIDSESGGFVGEPW